MCTKSLSLNNCRCFILQMMSYLLCIGSFSASKITEYPQCALIIMFKDMMLSHQQREDPFKGVFNITKLSSLFFYLNVTTFTIIC